MPLFSQREKITPLQKALQSKDLDVETRNELWNGITTYFFTLQRAHISSAYVGIVHVYVGVQAELAKDIWLKLFKQRVDHFPEIHAQWISLLEEKFWKWQYNEVFDFLEFIVKNSKDLKPYLKHFTDYCNEIFEKESVPYRFVSEEITKIISQTEIKEVEEAISGPFDPINSHLKRALELLSDRKAPDFRNSIKESISAVECISQIIVKDKKATLGNAFKKIEDSGVIIDPALKTAFGNLYGWTSSKDGIRHAMMVTPKVDYDDAKYMLVTCSAFVNYLITKCEKAGINLQSNYQKIK